MTAGAARERWPKAYVWSPVREAVTSWYDDSAPRWSAAIAFYTIFSLAPVLVIVTALAGALWGQDAVRAEVLDQFRTVLGDRGVSQVEALIENALPRRAGRVATAGGILTFLIGATAVFATLRGALNAVWGVADEAPGGVWPTVRRRLLSFALVLSLAFLLVASLLVSAALAGLARWIQQTLPLPIPTLRILDAAVSFTVLWVLFAAIFRWLPDARIAWSDVWIGAAFTSLLFGVGKLGIGLYLGHSGVANAYGVAGSVVLLLLWVYYSAMIFLLGAEFAQVYSSRWGSRIRPAGSRKGRRERADGFVQARRKGQPQPEA